MKKLYPTIFLTILIQISVTSNVVASTDNTQQKILKQIQDNLTRGIESKKLDSELKDKRQKLILPDLKIKVPSPPPKEDKVECKKIKKVKFTDNRSLSKRELSNIEAQVLGKCINIHNINEAIRITSNKYVDKGYVTTKAFVVPQDSSTGVIEILVVEGTLESIEFDNNAKGRIALFDKIKIASAFGDYKNKALNIRDIEQGLDQFNRLSSNNITMKLLPGSESGKSKIVITDKNAANKEQKKNSIIGHLSIGADNAGQELTGEKRKKINGELNNIFQLNDSWYISATKDMEDMNHSKGSESLYVSMNVPYNYYNFSAAISRSSYIGTITDTNSSISVEGITNNQSYRIDKVVFRNKIQKITANLNLALKDSESFSAGTLNQTQSYLLTVGSFGISDTIRSQKGVFVFGGNYYRGLDWLNAKSDESGLRYDQNVAQFEKIDFNFNYYKQLKLLGKNVNLKSSLNGQYSNDHLYSSEQISIGDEYSVKGFKEDTITGDSGGYLTNELAIYLPGFITNKYNINKILKRNQFFVSYDIGYARQRGGKETNNSGEGYVSGFGLGIRYDGKYLNYNMTYAKAINHPIFITPDSEILYLSSNIKF